MDRILTGLTWTSALWLWAAITSGGLDLAWGAHHLRSQKLINPGFAFLALLFLRALRGRHAAYEPAPAPARGRRTLVACWLFVIVPVSVLAWGRALEGDFIREDFQRLEAVQAGQPLNGSCWSDARFCTFWSRQASLAVDALTYPWFGLDARGWHALNLALHLAVALLTGLLALALTGRCDSAVLAAALQALAPWASEPVCWIAARDDTCAALYGLLAALALVRAVRAPGRGLGWLAASVAATVLALFSKESALSLPGALLPVAWLAGAESCRSVNLRDELRPLLRAARYLVPHVIALAVYLTVRGRLLAVQGFDPDQAFTDWQKLLLWPLSPLGPLAFPVNMYELPELPAYARALAGAGLLGALAAASAHFRAFTQRASLAWYALMLLLAVPVYRMIHLSGSLQNNRYVYLPGVGWALLYGHLLAINARGRARLAPLVALGVAFVFVRINAQAWVTAGVVAGRLRTDLAVLVEPLAHHPRVRVDGVPDQWCGAFLFNLADLSGPLMAFQGLPHDHKFRLVELYHAGAPRPPRAPGEPEYRWTEHGFVAVPEQR